MKHKLSPWHSADTKPVHVGIYQVKQEEFNWGVEYSFWNGGRWSPQRLSIKSAMVETTYPAQYQNKQWRGIVK